MDGYKYLNGDASIATTNGVTELAVNGHHVPETNGIGESPKSVEKNNFPPPMDRIKRKAKRLTKFLAKEVSSEPVTVTSRQLKNSRKSRNGLGRGLPKKGKNKIRWR